MSATGIPVVALLGRPNVGKSALFNRIVGRETAIVSEEAGTTRDRHFARADWSGRAFWLVDTGGVADDPQLPMDVEIRRQVQEAIGRASLLPNDDSSAGRVVGVYLFIRVLRAALDVR